MRKWTGFLAATVLAAAWQLSGLPASAQDQPAAPNAQSPTTGAAQPSAKISDDKLDKAAAAMQRVAKLQEDLHQQMQQAAAAAKEQAEKAVSEQGLSVEEYTSILETAQNDPDVREKLLARINNTGGQDQSTGSGQKAPSGAGK